jgi:DUF1680 family protein
MIVKINDQLVLEAFLKRESIQPTTSSGFDPRRAEFRVLQRSWEKGDVVVIQFEMPVQLRQAHPRVKGYLGKATISRGPLVYCLEDIDNPAMDIFNVKIAPGSLALVDDPGTLGGIMKIAGRSTRGESLTLIPYFLWGNRGTSKMTVWIHI